MYVEVLGVAFLCPIQRGDGFQKLFSCQTLRLFNNEFTAISGEK